MASSQTLDLGSRKLELSVIEGTVTGKETSTETEVFGNAQRIETVNHRQDAYQLRQADGTTRAISLFDAKVNVMVGNHVAFIVGHVPARGHIFVYPAASNIVAAMNKTTGSAVMLDDPLASLVGFDNARKYLGWVGLLGGGAIIWTAISSSQDPSFSVFGHSWPQWLAAGVVLLFLGWRARFGKGKQRLATARRAVEEMFATLNGADG